MTKKEKTFCIYFHFRGSDNKIFYVGIGSEKRAKSKFGRSVFWQRVVRKHGLRVEITKRNLCWFDACSLEKKYIKKYGRINTKTGCLVNLTDGGDGMVGIIMPQAQKEATRRRAIDSNPMKSRECKQMAAKWMSNRIVSDETRRKQSNRLKGKPTSFMLANKSFRGFGGDNPAARKVLNIVSGEVYATVSIAAESVNLKRTTLIMMLNGSNPNKTNLRYA